MNILWGGENKLLEYIPHSGVSLNLATFTDCPSARLLVVGFLTKDFFFKVGPKGFRYIAKLWAVLDYDCNQCIDTSSFNFHSSIVNLGVSFYYCFFRSISVYFVPVNHDIRTRHTPQGTASFKILPKTSNSVCPDDHKFNPSSCFLSLFLSAITSLSSRLSVLSWGGNLVRCRLSSLYGATCTSRSEEFHFSTPYPLSYGGNGC